MTEAAIFDLDGTLVNLPIKYAALYEEFKNITGIQTIEPLTKTVSALNVTLKGRIFDAWTAAEFAVLPKMTIVEEGVKIYYEYSDKPKALVTMQGRKTVDEILKTLHLTFQVIVTREDSLDRTTQVKMAIKKLGLKPEDVIVIGDRETDRTAAEKIGCKFKLVK